MLAVVEMLGSMFILGRVTAAHVSADKTHAQVNPGITGFNALVANMFARCFDFDLIEVGTLFGHRFLLLSRVTQLVSEDHNQSIQQ
jgi:hypothetical protein